MRPGWDASTIVRVEARQAGLHSKLVHRWRIAFVYGEMIRLRDVETGDLALFFEHQRDSVAVAMVAFKARDRDEFNGHWAKARSQ